MEILYIDDNEELWLEKRKELITSTDIAALLGVSKYKTPYRLYHEKVTGNISGDVEENDAMLFGRKAEAVIAEFIAEKEGWDIEAYKYMHYDTNKKLGASYDYIINNDDGTKTILEIKSTTSFVVRNTYDMENMECPYEYELQVQMQMHMSDIKEAILAVFILDTRKYHLFYRKYDAELCAMIEQKVKDFYNGSEPAIDYSADYDIIKENASLEKREKIASDDEAKTIVSLANERTAITEQEKELKKRKKEIEAELMFLCGDANKTIADNVTISITEQKRKGKLITEDMVGTYLGASEPFKVLRVRIK